MHAFIGWLLVPFRRQSVRALVASAFVLACKIWFDDLTHIVDFCELVGRRLALAACVRVRACVSVFCCLCVCLRVSLRVPSTPTPPALVPA
jgi:hypothetical protein